ncbi:MAG: hypothetical protein GX616_00915 [Planctomycetes bacterium]|nr:hypothetical protein [Planctomycetota bacterium]
MSIARLGQIVLIMALLGAVTLPSFGQTLVNPSFESHPQNPTGWTAFGDGATDSDARVYTAPTYGLTAAFDGQRVYGAVKDGARMNGGIYQRISGTTPGVTYRARVRIYTFRTGDGEMRCGIGLDPYGGTSPYSENTLWFDPISSNNRWSVIEVTAQAKSSTITVFLDYGQSGMSGFAINYFDLVELIANPPPPPPCADPEAYMETGLTDRRIDLNQQVEAQHTVPPGYVITGIGARGSDGNVSRMRVRQNPLLPDGSLGEPEEVRFGYDPIGGLEANISLPPCYVAVGYGARAAGEFDVMTLALWARPILADGSLGPVEEFRAGFDAYHPSLEREFLADSGRVLTGVGLRMQFSDITDIWAETDRYRVYRPAGDFDLDGDVDQEDFAHLQACVSGQGITQASPVCQNALLDDDDDVDQEDLAIFQACLSGPGVLADLRCGD